VTSTAERLLTEEEFLDLPEDPAGRKLELLDGRVVCMPGSGEQHGEIAQNINIALWTFARSHSIGRPFMDTGFKLRSGPDRIVTPNVAFVARGSLAPDRDRTKSVPGAPQLAVEVVSPNDRDTDVASKVLEYFTAGAQRVWVVRPTTESVTVHSSPSASRTFFHGETLTSNDAGFSVEGFELPVAAIFAAD
jgi:Uma2 family endonuclease